MKKEEYNSKQEFELDQFIDTLNKEQIPTESSDKVVTELQTLVREIKRQRPIPEPNEEFSQNLYRKLNLEIINNDKTKTKTNKPRKNILPLTAFVASILALFLLFNPWSHSDKNILLAMEQSVKQLQNYHGVLEKVSSNAAGEKNVVQRVEIWSDEDKYASLEEDGTVIVNNGDRYWSVQPQNKQITLLPIYLDPYDFDLSKEAAKALQYPHTIIGEETVADRSATRIQINPPAGLPYDLWIDAETHLPIKIQTAMQKSIQTTYTFVSLETNIEIPSSRFTFNTPAGYQLVDLSPNKLVASLEEAIAVSGITPLQPSDNLEKPKRYFASANQIVFDFGDTFIILTKTSDPFNPSPLATLGQAAGNRLEVLPNSLRWQQNGLEIKVQGQRPEELAKKITEDIDIPKANQPLGIHPQIQVEIDMEIVKNNQQQVDSGSSPWQLDPVHVAFTFTALQISPKGISGEPPIKYESLKVASNNGVEALIQISEGPIRAVYVKRLIRQDESGIWTVIGYDPR